MSDTANARSARPFNEWLIEQRKGSTHVEMTDKLNELSAAVAAHGKKGDLTLKITITPKGDGVVFVEDSIILKAPEASRSPSLYFIDDEHNLQRDNPNQTRLDIDGDNVRKMGS